jgi:predicted pyridoxine 5'-phosphate oxidase superfamily flavin-nucleotide-binding protein
MANRFHDLAFTPGVKDAQAHYGSRAHYSKFEDGPAKNFLLTDAEADFIKGRDGFYMATVSETAHPYIQFRGGPRGFLKVLDEQTLAFADFRGNLQYISVGNLSANNKAALFLMDYANQRRLKIMAEVEVQDASAAKELIENLRIEGYKARVERAIVLHVEAFDWNCPQHITPRYTSDEVREITRSLSEHIERLEAKIEKFKKEQK